MSILFSWGAEIRVAVAANASYAMPHLIKAFEIHYPHTKVQMIIGSSGKLTAQIKHAAPFDMFLSADMQFPQALYDANMSQAKPVMYAQGALVLYAKKKRDFTKRLHLLTEDSIKKIAIANPKTAPYGLAAKEALEKVKLYQALADKYVYGESISQTIFYAKKAADIGIIAKSALYAPNMREAKEGTQWIEIDSTLYNPIKQGMVRLNDKPEVKAFYDFILGAEAQAILKSFGYLVP